jgi:hypothetical protein
MGKKIHQQSRLNVSNLPIDPLESCHHIMQISNSCSVYLEAIGIQSINAFYSPGRICRLIASNIAALTASVLDKP